MVNRLTHIQKRSRRARYAAFAAVALLVLAAALWHAPLQGVLWSVLKPVVQARFGGEGAQSAATLASTTALLADREALYVENLDLKKRLGRDAGLVRILGAVLLRPPMTPYDTLLIDAGSEEGIAAGDRVAAAGTALIGRVSEVYPHAARVVLYSAPGEKHEGLLRGSVPVEFEGQGGGSLTAKLPAGTSVSAGDPVLLPGIAGGLAGDVSYVERAGSESFVTLYIRLPADPFSLRYVEVWKEMRHDTN
ncbi:hypothetical protein EXS62_03320 [Candidatus Kaiserbacteria bacterium]|nr:hypothetical protein [Candidatus Kaiserbacteria bacterium]